MSAEETTREPRPHALVVEDDQDVRLLIRAGIGDTCWVLEARSVDEGLRLAAREPYDLIVFDGALRGFEPEAVAVLRANPRTASTPVFVLLEEGQELDLEVQVVRKPVDPVELEARVALALGREPEAVQPEGLAPVSSAETRPSYRVACDTDASTLASHGSQLSTAARGDGLPRGAPAMREGDQVAERYVVRALLGRGGMGEVYLVHDPQTERELALKVMRAERSRKIDRQRFLEEARIASVLKHERVVQIHDFGSTADGRLYFVMDYCPGGTLSALLRRELRLPPARAVAIALQLLEALDVAHHQGILHRDIKPSNIVLDGEDQIRILDFGLAKDVLHAEGDLARSPGRSLGTPLYMSPEHVRGEPSDPRTDLYAVGVVLYEMLLGRPPFQGSSSQEVMHGHLRIAPEALSEAAGVPEALSQVVLKALAKERRDRWQTAGAFAQALERWEG